MGFPGSSAGKESTCNSGDPGPISESGRSTGEGVGYPPQYSWASQVALVVKNLPAKQETLRDASSIPRSGRFPGVGNVNSLQYSCLENPMDRGAL